MDLRGQSASTAVGHPFSDEVIVSIQEPTNVFVASCTAIEAPNRPFVLCWR